MRKVVLTICLVVAFLLGGCTSAGPYVTNVAYDGQGDLLVTKNTVVFDMFLGIIKTGDKEQTTVIRTPK